MSPTAAPASPAHPTPPSRVRRVSQLDLVQYVLAALNLLALVLGMSAMGRAHRLVTRATEETQTWATMLGRYADLATEAALVNQPGNDLFESRDVPRERSRFEASLAELNQLMTGMYDVLIEVPESERRATVRDFDAVEAGLTALVPEARRIFERFEAGDEAAAVIGMSRTGRAYARLQNAMNRARKNIGERSLQTIEREQRAIASLRRVQYIVVACMLLLVAMAFMHGRRIAMRTQQLSRERRQALDELRDKEQQLQQAYASAARQRDEMTAIINATSDGLMLFTTEPRVAWANNRAAEFLGFAANDLSTRPPDELRALVASRTEEPDTFMTHARMHFATAHADHVDQLVLVTPHRRVLRRHSRPAYHGSEVIGRVFTYTDMTREADLQRARVDFVTRASHELRTPLTSIHGALQLVMSGTAANLADEDRELLEISVGSTERLVRLVNRMLDLSKIEVGRMPMERVPVEPCALLQEAVVSMQPEATARQTRLELACACEGRLLLGDRDLLLRVMANLISNAVKYSPPASLIMVACRAVADGIEVVVEDEGPGLSEASLAKLFQPFSRVGAQAREQSGGTGLGLSLCRAIVDQHEGRIRAENRTDRHGSRFIFTVPEATADTPARH